MQRQQIPTTGGQYTNVDEFASGRPGQIVNLMLDEAGTLTSRPGLLSFSTPTDAATPDVPAPTGANPNPQGVIGLHAYGDWLIMVKRNRRIFRINAAGTALDITDRPLGGNSKPTFLELDSGELLIMGGGEPIVINKRVRAVQFGNFAAETRPRATHGAIVNRRLVLNEYGTDNFYASPPVQQNAFDESNPEFDTGVQRAGSRSDTITAMITYRNLLFAFGEKSCEVWYGTQETYWDGKPFAMDANPPQTSLIAPRSLVEADETLWWMDRERRINRLEGRQAKVKSLAIENSLRQLTRPEECVAHNIEIAGHHLVTFTFEADAVTYAYDYVLDAWTEWRRWDASPRSVGTWLSMPLDAYAYHPKWNKHYCGGAEAGTVYELSQTTYQDNSQPLRRLWRGPAYDHGTMLRKRNRRYTFLLDGGVATSHRPEGPITAFGNNGSGTVYATSTAHGLSTGDKVQIVGSSYDGTYTITKNDANNFNFTGTFVATSEGTWKKVSGLTGAHDPRIEVRWRDEDRRWKTKYVSVHLGKIGNIDTTRDLWRCGEYQRRQLEWQCTAPVALRVNRIEEEYDPRSR